MALLPNGHDPDTFIREKGLAELNQLLEQAESLPEFVLNRLIQENGLTLDGKSRIVEELQPLVKAAVSPLQRSVFVSHFAEKLGMPTEQLDGHLESLAIESCRSSCLSSKKRSRRTHRATVNLSKAVGGVHDSPTKIFFQTGGRGLRECLAGGVGEILFLQLRACWRKIQMQSRKNY